MATKQQITKKNEGHNGYVWSQRVKVFAGGGVGFGR